MQKNGADVSMRLDRLLCITATDTRSRAKQLVRSGRVSVNGKRAEKADLHIQPGDLIAVDGQTVDARTVRHVMLNKPCGVLTAARDKKQRTVIDLLPPVYAACGCMPVGRLDKNTEGLLLLTTDGELAHRLLSPRSHVWKCYRAVVDGPLSQADAAAFAAGLSLSDFEALPARLEILSSSPSQAEALVWVEEGKFHQVRRMFESRGRTVTALKRLQIGPLSLDDGLAPGEYRELTEGELDALRKAAKGETDER